VRDHPLEQTIAAALRADPCVDDNTIAVACFDGGQVVLRGSAESPAEATHALRTANQVAGVRTVDDRVRVRRRGVGHRADARTEAAVLEAFIADDVLPAEAMHVSASDGTVTLSGVVDLPFQRDEAEAIAKRVPGVSQLRNQFRRHRALRRPQPLRGGPRWGSPGLRDDRSPNLARRSDRELTRRQPRRPTCRSRQSPRSGLPTSRGSCI
jgi:osmotically-inducible protein OsmY